MANTFPYISSGGPLTQTFTQFRKSFPSVVDAPLLKKLGIAPNNESYIINILRFLKLIDEDGNKNIENSKMFLPHKDEDFQAGLEKVIQASYEDLFELHGPDTWSIDQSRLITFFRNSDQTSDLVGRRQASTFVTLGVLAGKRQATAAVKTLSRPDAPKPRQIKAKASNAHVKPVDKMKQPEIIENKDIGGVALTVRVEINLPAQGDQETYDRIFKSIRENLINGR